MPSGSNCWSPPYEVIARRSLLFIFSTVGLCGLHQSMKAHEPTNTNTHSHYLHLLFVFFTKPYSHSPFVFFTNSLNGYLHLLHEVPFFLFSTRI
ncbi:hypothetical protein CIPAW_13G085600 [Carya illinoinensis]|uniref:Uncharacterized protein n=1 Tax=Carya illinoinensis TaxID=32201 RepID=A0A8T1NRJ7_CARIL|nr:hypothetical protein CIPAW_13G085600 [Carya illinoinensis]KAG6631350.1 hypothetical protein CIPAW_13G085600 [Carya illinoinensis]